MRPRLRKVVLSADIQRFQTFSGLYMCMVKLVVLFRLAGEGVLLSPAFQTKKWIHFSYENNMSE